ncbi:Peptidyl-prolyl cis-trans isomerase FKBP16-3 [Picochlorum sp. SENEW3]|nr:Peptidyl-prolyl cis-trans isomerase FKBP16-3 [Picochlorum sp. SENEW3]
MASYRMVGATGQTMSAAGIRVSVSGRPAQSTRIAASYQPSDASSLSHATRRTALMLGSTLVLSTLGSRATLAEGEEDGAKLLCDDACASELATKEKVTLPSGLAFQDIKVGTGPAPPVGYQVVLHYILMNQDGRVISNSLENGNPYDIRVGTGQVVAGLDEGLKTMRVGGIRRVYVPGELSFPKGLPAGPGRPRVAPNSPVVFDVQLLYVPGLDTEDDE